jgi:hypothetical protein
MRLMNLTGAALAAMAFAGNAAADFSLEILDKDPPAEIRDEVKSQLLPKAYVLSDSGTPFYEFWFVEKLTAAEDKGGVKETLDAVAPVSLLGAMIVHEEERYDFREDPIDPGTYIVRLSLQPQDGNHMGTSPYDTFLVLVPLDADEIVAEYMDHDEMVELALEPTATAHPPILALQPMDSADGEFPRIDENTDEQWHFLCLKWPTAIGDKTIELPLQIVFEGIGEL